MRWVVIGAHGQLGTRLVERLPDAIGLARADLDITSKDDVDARLRDLRPEIMINAAAYTDVDAAESHEEAATEVNGVAVRHLAASAARLGTRLIHISTDYVFDGAGTRPHEPADSTAPRTAYGRSKLLGEGYALSHGGQVVRTAWVYGGPGPNFVDTMLRLALEQPYVDVVADQFGSPTYVCDLADALIELGGASVPSGILHYVNSGTASWFDVAQQVFRSAGHSPERVRPVSSDQFVRPAPRPAWSVLSTAAWTSACLSAPRPWQEAVEEYVCSTPTPRQ